MKINDCTKRGALAVGLTVEDAIDSSLSDTQLGSNPRLTPLRCALDFPKQGCDVFVHMT
jgi:hypothetical protein